MRRFGVLTRTATALACLMTQGSLAAAEPPYDAAIDVQLFDYAIGPKTFLTVTDGDVAPKGMVSVDMLVTYLTNPFTIYNVDPDSDDITSVRARVVRSLLAGQLTAAYGLRDTLQLGIALPMIFAMSGDGIDPATAMPLADGLELRGLGDLALEGKWRMVNRRRTRVAALLTATLPSSFGTNGSSFLGDDLPTLRPRLAGQIVHGRFSLGLNVGAILRKPRQIYASEIGQQLTFGAAATLRVTERVAVIGESFGRTGLTAFDVDQSPIEASGGIRIQVTNTVSFLAGGGTGLIKGIGSPDLRAFFAFGYAPDVRDTDRDAIVNSRDACPDDAEDRDGWQDLDGCPEADNDGDMRADAVDKCVNQAEDLDGVDDDDGCPELDNDGDGIADLEDRCPMDPEDKQAPNPADGCPIHKRDSDGDGLADNVDKCPDAAEDQDEFEDADGCPDPDNDQDGVADGADQCGLCKEDRDGIQDTDGCPEFDVDNDGVADAADKCPDAAETINSIADDDGCPDEGGIAIAHIDGDRLVVDRAPTFENRKLSRAGELIVDQIALVMRSQAKVTKWVLAYASPSRKFKDEGEAIAARLRAQGVAAESFELLAAKGEARIGGIAQARADGAICPAEYTVPGPAPTQPAAAAPTTSD